MTREIDASVITASQQDVIRPVPMVDLDFSSGHVRVHGGPGSMAISYGGNSFTGLGELGSISAVRETIELESYNYTLSLSGVDAANISNALNENYQGRTAIIYLAMLDSSHQLIGTPMVLARGRMDSMNITIGATATVSVNVQSAMAAWSRPKVRRYNNESQKTRYPSDKGLSFVEDTVRKQLRWGA